MQILAVRGYTFANAAERETGRVVEEKRCCIASVDTDNLNCLLFRLSIFQMETTFSRSVVVPARIHWKITQHNPPLIC